MHVHDVHTCICITGKISFRFVLMWELVSVSRDCYNNGTFDVTAQCSVLTQSNSENDETNENREKDAEHGRDCADETQAPPSASLADVRLPGRVARRSVDVDVCIDV